MSLKFIDQRQTASAAVYYCRFAIIIIYIFPFINAQCDKATIAYTKLSMAFQHVQGTPKTTSYAHVLSTTQAFDGATCSAINPSLVLEAPYGDCTSDCLTYITPYMYTNGTNFVDIVMLKPDQVSMYPDYIAHDSKIYCATTSGYCGATVPLYTFVSTKYADHYTSADKTITDSDYALDNGGVAQCYGWSMPTQEADKYDQANFYSASDPAVCDAFIYFSIPRSTTMSSTSTASSSTNTGTTSSNTVITTSSKSTTGATTASTTNVQTTTVATTKASTTMPVTTAKITTPAATTAAAGTTKAATTAPPATTTTAAPKPLTDSSGNPVTDASGNTITVPPATVAPGNPVTDANGNPVTDSSGNVVTYPPAKDDQGKKKGGLPVWVWVVLGVGIGVLALAIIGMALFVRSNFNSKPVRGRVNPYDRDLYTTDGMYDVPPVPVQTMPAQAAANVGSTAAGHGSANYAGIGIAESSVI